MQTPLLLLHGALGSAAQFDDLRRKLPPEWTALAPHFPGHGGTPAGAHFSIDAFAHALLELLDRHGIPKAHCFGYSMGGYAAMHLAWKHPQRVKSIVTLGTKFNWTPETAAIEAARLDPGKIQTKVPAFAQMLADRHAPANWQELVRQTAGLLHALGNGAALGPETFRTIACPVRIGRGTEDNMVTPAESEQVAGWLPAGQFEALPGVKHPWEQIDVNMLAGWLLQRFS